MTLNEIFIFSVIIGILFGLYYFWKKKILEEKSPISLVSGVFAVLLTIAILVLLNGLWGDIVPSIKGVRSEVIINKLIFQGFLIRSIYMLVLVGGSLLLYFAFYRKGEKYSMVVLPYFVGSIIITGRWLVETCRMIIEKYAKMGVYAILAGVIILMSFVVYYAQEKKERFGALIKKEETKESPSESSE